MEKDIYISEEERKKCKKLLMSLQTCMRLKTFWCFHCNRLDFSFPL